MLVFASAATLPCGESWPAEPPTTANGHHETLEAMHASHGSHASAAAHPEAGASFDRVCPCGCDSDKPTASASVQLDPLSLPLSSEVVAHAHLRHATRGERLAGLPLRADLPDPVPI